MQVKKRNRMAGKHPSYKKAGMSASSIAKKRAYDKAYNSTPARKKYRAELNGTRRKLIKSGKLSPGSKLDVAHKSDYRKGGSLKNGFSLQPRSTNRGYRRR